MGMIGQLIKYAAMQVGMSAISVASQEVGREVGKVGVKEFKKRVLKEPEQPPMRQIPQSAPINTGNTVADIVANVAKQKFEEHQQKKVFNEQAVNTPVNAVKNTAPETSMAEDITAKAEVAGEQAKEVASKAAANANKIVEGFKKGLNKKR